MSYMTNKVFRQMLCHGIDTRQRWQRVSASPNSVFITALLPNNRAVSGLHVETNTGRAGQNPQ
jgi:hypothetical protein